ncbi:hypothetical protein B0H17DRAFT_1205628 [Mycena rosella]|uniref:Uncharacterized protein n=1 Tax=Mycena rosella TaxID=1033263 RepID=A0AAD7D6K8_MYCRO|nr:hypothetical protein B0H17DRAFT_1205628 [Mycena rosella]
MHNEPAFPVELEREIFETTALMHSSTIPTLLRVARRILLWIEPLLYRVICTSTDGDIARALLKATKSKPPKFFHDAVRHIFLGYTSDWSVEEAVELLELCTGIVDCVALGALANPVMLPILANMRLERLSVSLQELFGPTTSIDPTHPLFKSITHLDLLQDIIDGASTCAIPALPALTHLCLADEVSWDVVGSLLEECPRLEILVNLWDYEGAPLAHAHAGEMPFRDLRFVMGLYKNWINAWVAGAKGLPDFWSRADDFVACKRRGAIAADCYWLEQPDDASNVSQSIPS